MEIHVVGTVNIKNVDIIKDSKVVATMNPGGRELRETWTDPAPSDGTHYYYVRVLQEDGELAWSSPMWMQWAK
jgi:hypothetical protein